MELWVHQWGTFFFSFLAFIRYKRFIIYFVGGRCTPIDRFMFVIRIHALTQEPIYRHYFLQLFEDCRRTDVLLNKLENISQMYFKKKKILQIIKHTINNYQSI